MILKHLAKACGITYQKLNYWIETGKIPAPSRSDTDLRAKHFTDEQVDEIMRFFGETPITERQV